MGFYKRHTIMVWLVYLLPLVLGVASAFSVRPLQIGATDQVLAERNWTAFDQKSGLVGRVSDLFEDRDGNIWLATSAGVQRYDGYSWTTYTGGESLSIGLVNVISQGADGVMWFGVGQPAQLLRYDGAAWDTFVLKDSLVAQTGYAALLPARDGTWWAGLQNIDVESGKPGGIIRFDGRESEVLIVPLGPPRPNVNHILEARDGTLWFATEEGVLCFDGELWIRYTVAEGLAYHDVGQIFEAEDGALWFACTRGLSRFDGENWHSYAMPDEIMMNSIWQTKDGTIWASGAPGVLFRFDGMSWQPYTRDQIPPDGLLSGWPARDGSIWMYDYRGSKVFRFDPQGVWTVYGHREGLAGGFEAADGSIWFHTLHRAVRLHNGHWMSYGPEDGFVDGEVWGMHQTGDGALFFIGTDRGRSTITHFDGNRWRIFSAEEGAIDSVHQTHPGGRVAANFRSTVLQARDGAYWFAGNHAGAAAVARFDGENWQRYTTADGLAGNWASGIYQSADGVIWTSSYDPYSSGMVGFGLFSFDGSQWQRHTRVDGFEIDYVTGFGEWPDGTLWVGGSEGISRLSDGEWWTKDDFGVPTPKIRSLFPTARGLWFAFLPNRRAGVVFFDGKSWQRFREANGLLSNGVSDIVRTRDGALWFAAERGISRYDGKKWIGYGQRDGLQMGWIFPSIRPAHDGSLWIDGSALEVKDMQVTHLRFPADRNPPQTRLEPAPVEVSARGNILLRWSGLDRWSYTPVDELRYQWRLDGARWSAWSRRQDHTLVALHDGEYRFEVRAMDREGNIEEIPPSHVFSVDPPWWKSPPVVLLITSLVGFGGLQTRRYLVANRKLQETQARLIVELEQELETAHALQMGLMPDASPRVEGFDIAGMCRPATHVGGDFFQFYERDGMLTFCLADVTGHAMEAAIPMVQFASVLEVELERGISLKGLFDRLNTSMHRALTGHTFVCFAMAQLDPASRRLRLSNGGCPYPYHFRAATGEVEEIPLDAYPLGVREGSEYTLAELILEPGDRIVISSDGLIEATDEAGDIFGFEKVKDSIQRSCREGLSAMALTQRLMAEVDAFCNAEPQGDDRTVVVLRVEG